MIQALLIIPLLFCINAFAAIDDINIGDVVYYRNSWNPPRGVANLEKVQVTGVVENSFKKLYLVKALRTGLEFTSGRRLVARANSCMHSVNALSIPGLVIEVCEGDEVAFYSDRVYRKAFVQSFWAIPTEGDNKMLGSSDLVEIKDAETGEVHVMPVASEDSSHITYIALKVARNLAVEGKKMCFDTAGGFNRVPFVTKDRDFNSATILCEGDEIRLPAGKVTGIFNLALSSPDQTGGYKIQITDALGHVQYVNYMDVFKN